MAERFNLTAQIQLQAPTNTAQVVGQIRKQLKGINVDAEIGSHMLYTTNNDVPGIIGLLGSILGKNGVNIANFTLGRADAGGEAIALLYVDEVVEDRVISDLVSAGKFSQVSRLEFDV